MSKQVKSKQMKKGISEIFQKSLEVGMCAYACILLFVFPLYYQNKYFNMGEAKYQFFRKWSMILLPVLFVLSILFLCMKYLEINKKKKLQLFHKVTATDLFVSAYGVAVLLSFLLTPYKQEAIWGYSGWYMGLASQISFILIYFLASRFLVVRRWLLNGSCMVSAIVFLLAVLNRFQIDPLNFYDNLTMDNKIQFLSTIGQATWYSSYLSIVFPIGVYLFWSCHNKMEKFVYGVYVALGFATMVTQNSDSAFIAFLLIILILFTVSLKQEEKLQRFLEFLVIGLGSIKGIGVLQLLFKEQAVPLESLSIFASQGALTTILFILSFAILLLYSFGKKEHGIQIQKIKWIGTFLWILLGVGISFFVLCMIWNVKGKLPGFLSGLKKIEYFTFDDEWGNGRGFTWRNVVEIFREYSFRNKIFGCGPDCFVSYAYTKYADTLNARWGNKVLTNAHNEWLTSLLFFGYFGLFTYLGIFIFRIRECVKCLQKDPFQVAVLMSIAAYMGHNFFCYQQIVCTPIIFLIMGMVQGKEKGKTFS